MDNSDKCIALENIVSDVGRSVNDYFEEIADAEGNIGRLIDEFAYKQIKELLSEHMPGFYGTLVSEYGGIEEITSGDEFEGILIVDEVDGTRAAERWTKRNSVNKFPGPSSSIVMGLCESNSLGSVVAGAVYYIRYDITLSGLKGEKGYKAYVKEPGENKEMFDPGTFDGKNKGDDEIYIMVADYSTNKHREIGDMKQAIRDNSDGEVFKVAGGRHPTSADIGVEMILTHFRDAYIDPRAIWGEEGGTSLYPHDIVGVLPAVWGCGLETADIYGKDIKNYPVVRDKPLTLIVARNGFLDEVVRVIAPIIS
jgi:hypothetical protein